MNKQREKKAAVVKELKEKLHQAEAAVITDYRGLKVGEMNTLRARLRQAGTELKVTKNTLTWIAAQELGLTAIYPYLQGPTAIAFNFADPAKATKVLTEFAREHKALEIKGGLLKGRVISANEVKRLAELPPREVLIAQLLGIFQLPLVRLAGLLQTPLQNWAYTLEAVKNQKAGNLS